jgi:hypothetical protein
MGRLTSVAHAGELAPRQSRLRSTPDTHAVGRHATVSHACEQSGCPASGDRGGLCRAPPPYRRSAGRPTDGAGHTTASAAHAGHTPLTSGWPAPGHAAPGGGPWPQRSPCAPTRPPSSVSRAAAPPSGRRAAPGGGPPRRRDETGRPTPASRAAGTRRPPKRFKVINY